MANKTLKAQKRIISGRKVKKLRESGSIPANIFGKAVKSESIQVLTDEFLKIYKEVGETNIIELDIDKKKRPVLISQVQLHPVDEGVLHIDFRQVDLTEKITAMIPLKFIGESPAEKTGIGTVVSSVDEIEVESLPADLPDMFEIDLGILANVEDQIKVGDIKYNTKKVKILTDIDQVVSRVEPPQKEEVVTEVVTPPTEGEVKTETSKEEPQAPEGEGQTS